MSWKSSPFAFYDKINVGKRKEEKNKVWIKERGEEESDDGGKIQFSLYANDELV